MANSFKKITAVLLVLLVSAALVFAADGVTGRLLGKVLTNNGDMLVAGITIVDEEGNSHRETTNAYGGYVLNLLPGTYTLTFDKGIEFSTFTQTVTVESYKTYYLKDVRLAQLFDSYAEGWIAGDVHQHTIFSDGLDTVDSLLVANASMGLYWGYLTDHDSSRGVPEWREATGRLLVLKDIDGEERYFNAFAGSEVTSSFGHYQSVGTGMTFDRYEIDFTEEEISNPNKKNIAREKAVYIAKQIHRAGGLAQINHPYSSSNMGTMNFVSETDWDFFDYYDTMEVWNGYFVVPDGIYTTRSAENQNYTSKLLWYSILNNMKNGSKFIAATGGTDDHDATGAAAAKVRVDFDHDPQNISQYYNLCRYERKYAGSPSTYVNLKGKDITEENVREALIAGNSFISNGPVVICTVGDKIYGDTVTAENGSVTLTTNIFAREGIETIRIVKNGEIVKTITVADEINYTKDITVTGLKSGDWFIIEVLAGYNDYAFTNPFFVK